MTLPLLQTLAAVDAADQGGPPIAVTLGWEAGDVALALAHAEDDGLIAGTDRPHVTDAGYLYTLRQLRPIAGLYDRAVLAEPEIVAAQLEAAAAEQEGADAPVAPAA